MDAVVDERTMREIYLTGFEIAVTEGNAKAIMSSYNQVNGTYTNENNHLLTEILRNEWGFDGFVVTDWGGDNDHTEGVRSGSNLVMPAPGPDCAIGLVEAVKAGRIEESVLDQRVEELLNVVFATYEAVEKAPKAFDVEAHHNVARRCAAESIVLLDNDGILPLKKDTKTAIIGDFALTPRYQGAGSSQVNPTKLENLKDALCASGLTVTAVAKGYSRTDPAPDWVLINEAVTAAGTADAVLLCVGLDEIMESEGMDRLHMELSRGQQALINAVTAANPNVILVLSGGAPFVMPDRRSYRAAIHGYLGGQAGACAMADAILGVVNPSGKLNETWPVRMEDNPSCPYFPSPQRTSEYREGLYVGYRYYDTVQKPVRYCFGHGLSYTTFAYSNIRADEKSVTFTLENTGTMDGAEVAQVYVSCQDGKIFRPQKELKGFQKVFLKAGEKKEITIALDDKAFRYFNVKTNRWETESAQYSIMAASAADDIRLTETVRVEGTQTPAPYGDLPSYRTGRIEAVSDEEYTALLGRPIPDGSWSEELSKNDALCQLVYAKSAPARALGKLLVRMQAKAEAKGKPDLNIMFVNNMPIRAINKMVGQFVSARMVEDIVFLVNGHFWRGSGRLIADFFRNQKASRAYRKILEKYEKV